MVLSMAIISPDSNGTSPASFRGFPELSVLIPAYNEEACIESVVREAVCVLHGMGRSFEVLVVDDGSSDGTPARLQGLCAEHAELRVLRLAANSGQSAALGAAFRAARGTIALRRDCLTIGKASLHSAPAAALYGFRSSVYRGKRHASAVLHRP